MWFVNNRNLFLIVLEARKSKVMALAESMSDKTPLSCSQMAFFSLCPYVLEGAKELSGAPFMKALIPFMSALAS